MGKRKHLGAKKKEKKAGAKAGKNAKRNLKAKPGSTAQAFTPFLRLGHIDDKTAVFVFLVVLVVIIFLLDVLTDQKALFQGSKTTKKVLTKEVIQSKILSKLVMDSRDNDGMGFIVKDTLDPELLEHFAGKSYEQVKKELNIDAEFAIHFEDANGNILPIGDKLCIGSESVKVQGIPCS